MKKLFCIAFLFACFISQGQVSTAAKQDTSIKVERQIRAAILAGGGGGGGGTVVSVAGGSIAVTNTVVTSISGTPTVSVAGGSIAITNTVVTSINGTPTVSIAGGSVVVTNTVAVAAHNVSVVNTVTVAAHNVSVVSLPATAATAAGQNSTTASVNGVSAKLTNTVSPNFSGWNIADINGQIGDWQQSVLPITDYGLTMVDFSELTFANIIADFDTWKTANPGTAILYLTITVLGTNVHLTIVSRG